MNTSTSDQTPKPETPTDKNTPKLKKIITSNQTSKPETTTSEQTPKTEPVGPIPPPDQPKQYRAIGLLKGRYVPGSEIERGTLITSDGTSIYAVVLGRLLGLVKSSRIDLEKEHIWVVYPRTRRKKADKSLEESGEAVDTTPESKAKTESPETLPELSKEPASSSDQNLEESLAPQYSSKEPTPDCDQSLESPDLSNQPKVDDEASLESPEELEDLFDDPTEDEGPGLHVQMAGIWSPETLHPDQPAPVIEQKPDYFSIRGEVVYQNADEGWLMVKIIQFSRRKPDEKPPYFNLKLLGFLPERPVKNFWSLDVERSGTNLVIQSGQRIADLGKKVPPKKGKPVKGKTKRGSGGQQPTKAAASPKEPPKLKKQQLSL